MTSSQSESLQLDRNAGGIVVVCGPPGVGKTTVAERATAQLSGELLRTDVIRKELYPEPTYNAEESKETYQMLFDRATTIADSGRTAVVDGTFRTVKIRERIKQRADAIAAEFSLITVTCDEGIVKERIESRDDISDADFDIHLMIKDEFEPIEMEHEVVDNSRDLRSLQQQVDEALGVASLTPR